MIKVLTTIGQIFTPENLKKLKDAKELISEMASELLGKEATLCEMYQLEKLDKEGLVLYFYAFYYISLNALNKRIKRF